MFSKDAERIGRNGKQALDRIKKGGRDWNDWRTVGDALIAGRELAMDGAHTNQPRGKAYNQIFGQYLSHFKLTDLDKSDRAKLLKVMEHIIEIEEWRQSLNWRKRVALNHPVSIWRAWQKETKVPNETTRTPKKQVKAMALNDEIAMLQKDKASLQAHVEELEQAREKPGSIEQARSSYVQLLSQLSPDELRLEMNNLLAKVREFAGTAQDLRIRRVAKRRKKGEI